MNRNEIRKWLIDAGLSQSEIARRVGVSISLVNKVLNGERKNELVIKALRKYGCPPELLPPLDQDEEAA
ncbi:MAG: helix-turn-helix domain-containing protein [Syntrophobacteraceae bacterium]